MSVCVCADLQIPNVDTHIVTVNNKSATLEWPSWCASVSGCTHIFAHPCNQFVWRLRKETSQFAFICVSLTIWYSSLDRQLLSTSEPISFASANKIRNLILRAYAVIYSLYREKFVEINQIFICVICFLSLYQSYLFISFSFYSM